MGAQQSKTSPVSGLPLPPEIVDLVCSNLPLSSQSSLSLTSRQTRRMVVPSLFKCIPISTATCSRESFNFIEGIVRYGHLVKELQIVVSPPTCLLQGCTLCDEHLKYKGGYLWPEGPARAAMALLRGDLDTFMPALRHIAVEFPSNFAQHDPYLTSTSYFIYPFPPNDGTWGGALVVGNQIVHPGLRWVAIEVELSNRAAAVFDALSARGAVRGIEHLTISNLPMYYSRVCGPPLTSVGWRAFLGCLKRFDLSLWAGPEEVYTGTDAFQHRWRQFVYSGHYTTFIGGLAGHFFDHLTCIKHLRFESSMNAAVGDRDNHRGSRNLPFVSEQSPPNTMPALEKLELVKIMVDQPLIDFLRTRVGGPPLALTLENTWAFEDFHREPDEDHRGNWATILDRLTSLIRRENKGLKLRSFEAVRYPRADPDASPLRYARLGHALPGDSWGGLYLCDFSEEERLRAREIRGHITSVTKTFAHRDQEARTRLLEAITHSNTS